MNDTDHAASVELEADSEPSADALNAEVARRTFRMVQPKKASIVAERDALYAANGRQAVRLMQADIRAAKVRRLALLSAPSLLGIGIIIGRVMQ